MAAIDSLFGPSRNELNVEMIRFAQRDNVRTLLSLLRQVPDELVTVPFVLHRISAMSVFSDFGIECMGCRRSRSAREER